MGQYGQKPKEYRNFKLVGQVYYLILPVIFINVLHFRIQYVPFTVDLRVKYLVYGSCYFTFDMFE